MYNATNNEYVRTNTITKNTIVSIDSHPFVQYFNKHYFGKTGEHAKIKDEFENAKDHANLKDEKMKSNQKKYLKRRIEGKIDPKLNELLNKGMLYACISSRPGQSGRADGYILEGKELEFYLKKIVKK